MSELLKRLYRLDHIQQERPVTFKNSDIFRECIAALEYPDHVLLPTEPTEAMIEAGMEAMGFPDLSDHIQAEIVANIYRAMLKEGE